MCVATYLHFPPSLFWLAAIETGPFTPWGIILASGAWLAVLGLAAYGVGRACLGRFRFDDLSESEEVFFSLALGAGALIMGTLALGAVGGLYRWPVRVAIILLAAWGAWAARTPPLRTTRPGSSPGSSYEVRETLKPLPRLPMMLAAAAWGVNLIPALGPETFYDSLLYHLGVPQLYASAHRMVSTPRILYSHLPFAQEMLYTLALLLQGDTLARLISWACGVGLAFGAAALGQRLGHPRSGAWTAALISCTPAVLFNGRVTGTENALSLWCLLALWAVLRWRDTAGGDGRAQGPPLRDRPYAWLILAGVFGGLAAGTKYVGVFACAVLGVMIVTAGRPEGRPLRARVGAGLAPALLFAGTAAIVFLPWPIRTAILSGGNPLHPYFSTMLKADAFPPGQLANWMHDTRGSELIASAGEYLLHPWILTVRQTETPHHVGPWPLALAPLALWALWRRRGSLEAVLAAFAVGYWALWAPASMGVRFLMPAFAPLGLSAFIVLITSITAGGGKPRPYATAMRRVAFSLATAVCLIGINRGAAAAVSESGWMTTLGRMSRDRFLRMEHLGYGFPPYEAYTRLNSELPGGARILLVGETRGAHLERPFLAGDSFDWPPAADLAAGAADGGEVLRRVREAGITHILVNAEFGTLLGLLGRWRDPARDAAAFEAFMNAHASRMFTAGPGITAFEIVDRVAPGRARPDIAGAVAFGPALLSRRKSGEDHVRAGRWKEALSDFEWLYGRGQRVEENLGYLYAKLGDLPRAESWFKAALARDPASEQAARNLEAVRRLRRRG